MKLQRKKKHKLNLRLVALNDHSEVK